MSNKKQIVFIEYVPTIPTLKIARSLKLTGKYETTLVVFSKIDKSLLQKEFDEIIMLDLQHKIDPRNILKLLKKISNGEVLKFFKAIRNLNPYLFQITGPDLFTVILMFITKKKPKIYFAYDIWEFFKKKFSLENLGVKEFFQTNIEKICFRKADGILHKGTKGELNLLTYQINKLDLTFIPGCLEERIYLPKNKKSKELHLVYAGGPLASWKGRISFMKILRLITSQGIHFHTYGCPINKSEKKIYLKESKKNRYYHFHEKVKVGDLTKEISKYDYGTLLDFFDDTIINPLWGKTSMAGKIIDYVEAGIPLIVNKQSDVHSSIVEKNGIGISIDYEDVKNIRKILEKLNYKKLQENIKKAQKDLSMRKIIQDIEKFYDKIVFSKGN